MSMKRLIEGLEEEAEAAFGTKKISMHDLVQLNLKDAPMRGMNLSGADLSSGSLEGAELFRANLRGATLDKASFKGATFHDANMTDADFTRAAYLNKAKWPDWLKGAVADAFEKARNR